MHSAQKPQAGVRKWKRWLGAALAPVLLSAGCATHAGTDALIGGGLGAGVGAIAGQALGHHAGAGALIGGALGAGVGGIAGQAQDNHEQRVEQGTQVRRQVIGLEDVVKLTQAGTGDAIIIDQVRSSGTVFHLTGDQILYLKQYGVHDPVIQELQMTAYRTPAPPVVVVREPRPQRVIVVEEGPPPPVVGVGLEFRGGRCR
jgi:outer membrane lipoprotein SlyB